MNFDTPLLTPESRAELETTVLVRHRLEEQYESLEHQHQASTLGMWLFLATEAMFFGALFLAFGTYRFLHPHAFEMASAALTWQIGAGNTLVLLVSSLTMALAVHHARHDERRRVLWCLGLTAILGLLFLSLKAVEYAIDYRDALVPGWRFDESEWVRKGLTPAQTGNVQLFLIFYWIMTGIHALHMLIGIAAAGIVFFLARRGTFSSSYYTPIDAVGLYWHFVDIVWIFLLPMLYLPGTHANVF